MLAAGSHDPCELAEAARRAIVPDLLRRRGYRAPRAGDLRARVRAQALRGVARARNGRARTGGRPRAARADRALRRRDAAGARGRRLHRGAAAGAGGLPHSLRDPSERVRLRRAARGAGAASRRGHRRRRTERAWPHALDDARLDHRRRLVGHQLRAGDRAGAACRAQHHRVLRGGAPGAVVAHRHLARRHHLLDRHAQSGHQSRARRRRGRELAVVVVSAHGHGDGVLLRPPLAPLARADRPRVLRAALRGEGRVVRARLSRALPRACSSTAGSSRPSTWRW